jgi:hypothetical protein
MTRKGRGSSEGPKLRTKRRLYLCPRIRGAMPTWYLSVTWKTGAKFFQEFRAFSGRTPSSDPWLLSLISY